MCVTATTRTMGCGKSLPRSPADSETDVRNSGSFKKNSSKNKATSKKSKKKQPSHDENNLPDFKSRNCDISEGSSSFRKISNGKSGHKEKHEDKGNPLSSSPSSKSGTTSPITSEDFSDKYNGASKPQGNYYLLEIPNEVYKVEASAKTTVSVKTFTATKTKAVHATTSQLEFFKMLDEKIEMGGDYQTSNEASEVSSIDEAGKQ